MDLDIKKVCTRVEFIKFLLENPDKHKCNFCKYNIKNYKIKNKELREEIKEFYKKSHCLFCVHYVYSKYFKKIHMSNNFKPLFDWDKNNEKEQ